MSVFNNLSFFCFSILIIVVIIIFVNNCFDYFKTENYTPSVVRYLNCNKSQNNCPFPYTNNKLEIPTNNNVYTYQYANRKLMNPEQYLNMIRHLLNDLSHKKINITNIPNELLKEEYYTGDQEPIIDFLNSEINNLVSSKDYLQSNGPWKFEYFNVSSPTIYYYKVNNENNMFPNLPNVFNLFKIIYVLGNPLRSSYTSCLAFITEINGKLELQFTTFVNDFEKSTKDKLDVVPSQALDFSFINTIATNNFDEYGHPNNYSGLNYIEEYRQGKPIKIKADIPNEFKKDNFNPQYLPPLFGNGICKYPPNYKTKNGENKYVNNPPLFPGVHF